MGCYWIVYLIEYIFVFVCTWWFYVVVVKIWKGCIGDRCGIAKVFYSVFGCKIGVCFGPVFGCILRLNLK